MGAWSTRCRCLPPDSRTGDAVLHDVDAGRHHIKETRVFIVFGDEVTHHLVPDAALFVTAVFPFGLGAGIPGQVGANQLGIEVHGDVPLLEDFALMDFHRAKEAIEEGRALVKRYEADILAWVGSPVADRV